jgi:5-oxoprolinase (ATP-hydrolysing)
MTDSPQARWQFWIDRGGTFTDIVARRRTDARRRTSCCRKSRALQRRRGRTASASCSACARAPDSGRDDRGRENGHDGRNECTARAQGRAHGAGITRGFGDALRIAYQNRPKLFVRRIELPTMLYERVIEIDERIGAHGDVVRELDLARGGSRPARAHADGMRACAIVLMHGVSLSAARAAARGMARTIGFAQVSSSHEVSPLMKLVSRGDTTVVDAYLSPILRRYVAQVERDLLGRRTLRARAPRCNSCSRAAADRCAPFPGQGRDPVGTRRGIVGAVQVSRLAGFDRIIGFDMGGTSTDVTHYAGEYERAFRHRSRRRALRAPMMRIHTVAAGGGSICTFDGARFRVGRSPPAPIRAGVLSPRRAADSHRLQRDGRQDRPGLFPHVFGPQGDLPLDADRRAREVRRAGGRRRRRTGHGEPGSDRREASCRSRSTTWRTRSSTFRSSAVTTSPSTRCAASAAPAASMPCLSPTRWA